MVDRKGARTPLNLYFEFTTSLQNLVQQRLILPDIANWLIIDGGNHITRAQPGHGQLTGILGYLIARTGSLQADFIKQTLWV